MSNFRFDLRTEVRVDPFPFSINYHTPVLFCGSCFAENMGSIMQSYKMPVLINPHGVVYNPLSVAQVIRSVLEGKTYTINHLHQHNGVWFSFDHYTRFSDENPDTCLELINQASYEAHAFIKTAKVISITFGTARVYRLKHNNQWVANCHKIPSREFTHNLLTVEAIVEEWTMLMNSLLHKYPEIRILFTVSPIRHWKDGAIGNQLSKATLLVAIHKLLELFPGKAFYFPSYEILMDDLRDYRFYDTDMLHPSPLAIEYIWQKFIQALIDKEAQLIAEKVHKIQLAKLHRPLKPNSTEFKQFVQKTLSDIEELQREYPFINLDEEMEYFSNLINF